MIVFCDKSYYLYAQDLPKYEGNGQAIGNVFEFMLLYLTRRIARLNFPSTFIVLKLVSDTKLFSMMEG